MPEQHPALQHLGAAFAHLNACAQALMQPEAPPPSTAADEGAKVARSAELFQEQAPLWAHVKKVAGGFWVSVSGDPIPTPIGLQVSDQAGQSFACSDFGEVCAVLGRRFGE